MTILFGFLSRINSLYRRIRIAVNPNWVVTEGAISNYWRFTRYDTLSKGSGNSSDLAGEVLLLMIEYLRMRSPAKIVEVGCGDGWLSERVSIATQRTIISTDISPLRLAKAKEVRPHLDFRVANSIEALKFAGKGDVLMSFNVLGNLTPDEFALLLSEAHSRNIEVLSYDRGNEDLDAPYFVKRPNEIGYDYNFGGFILDRIPDAYFTVLKKGVEGKVRAALFVFR
jgi:hypothetical protein